jgi:hypothetical protein
MLTYNIVYVTTSIGLLCGTEYLKNNKNIHLKIRLSPPFRPILCTYCLLGRHIRLMHKAIFCRLKDLLSCSATALNNRTGK